MSKRIVGIAGIVGGEIIGAPSCSLSSTGLWAWLLLNLYLAVCTEPPFEIEVLLCVCVCGFGMCGVIWCVCVLGYVVCIWCVCVFVLCVCLCVLLPSLSKLQARRGGTGMSSLFAMTLLGGSFLHWYHILNG